MGEKENSNAMTKDHAPPLKLPSDKQIREWYGINTPKAKALIDEFARRREMLDEDEERELLVALSALLQKTNPRNPP